MKKKGSRVEVRREVSENLDRQHGQQRLKDRRCEHKTIEELQRLPSPRNLASAREVEEERKKTEVEVERDEKKRHRAPPSCKQAMQPFPSRSVFLLTSVSSFETFWLCFRPSFSSPKETTRSPRAVDAGDDYRKEREKQFVFFFVKQQEQSKK